VGFGQDTNHNGDARKGTQGKGSGKEAVAC